MAQVVVPWWWAVALAGGFVALGAVITAVGGLVSEHTKLKREDVRQWDKDIRDLTSNAIQLANSMRVSKETDPVKFEKSRKEFLVVQCKMDILAGKDICEPLRKLYLEASGVEETPNDPHSEATLDLVSQVRTSLRLKRRKDEY